MQTAKIFQSGNSQAVRLPKEFRFRAAEVEIFRRGDEVVLREHPRTGREVFDILTGFPDDFMADGRDDAPPQAREGPSAITTFGSRPTPEHWASP